MNLLEKVLQSNSLKKAKRTFQKLTGLHIKVKRYSTSSCEELRTFKLLEYKNIDTVIDIGANVGQFAEGIISNGFKGQVLSFEPVKYVHSILNKNAKQYKNWIVAERCVIGNMNGYVDINVSDDSVFSSVLEIESDYTNKVKRSRIVSTEKVKSFKLDTVISDYIEPLNKRILLKIDTQGFEQQVLEGATVTLKGVIGIKIELPLKPIYRETNFTFYEIIDFLKERNFHPYSFYTEGIDHKTGRVNTLDGIFFKHDNDVVKK